MRTRTQALAEALIKASEKQEIYVIYKGHLSWMWYVEPLQAFQDTCEEEVKEAMKWQEGIFHTLRYILPSGEVLKLA